MICFPETWVTDNSICNDSNFQLENYTVLHQVRESGRWGGLSIFIHKEVNFKGVIYRVSGLRLLPNFVVRLVADKNFYLRLTVEKMHAFAVFSDRYLRPCGCSDTIFAATVDCTNPKFQILNEIIEMQIIGIPINFLFLC